MPYNYSKLDGKITEVFKNRRNFANAIGFSERTLSLKMNCKVPWSQMQIDKACNLLEIKISEIPLYFFTLEVQ